MNKYSLINPREKKVLRQDSKLWAVFVILLFGLYFLIYSVFVIMVTAVDYQTDSYNEERVLLEKKIKRVELNIDFVKSQEELSGKARDRNKIVADSVASILELIPDSIYLNEAVIEKNKLTIRGYTPSKEIYNYLLLPPLKSIFKETKTSFFPMDNGWFRFVSVNESEKESIYEK